MNQNCILKIFYKQKFTLIQQYYQFYEIRKSLIVSNKNINLEEVKRFIYGLTKKYYQQLFEILSNQNEKMIDDLIDQGSQLIIRPSLRKVYLSFCQLFAKDFAIS
ncbi:hypothetical protein pb186bvf_006962 [Paramecium bursaria]